jgi:hypothetical protein
MDKFCVVPAAKSVAQSEVIDVPLAYYLPVRAIDDPCFAVVYLDLQDVEGFQESSKVTVDSVKPVGRILCDDRLRSIGGSIEKAVLLGR